MAYEETSAEKAARKAREEANAKKGAETLKKADYEAFGSRGDAARKGMEEGKMSPAGDAYKKGGKVKKMAMGGMGARPMPNMGRPQVAPQGFGPKGPAVAPVRPMPDMGRPTPTGTGVAGMRPPGQATTGGARPRMKSGGKTASARADGCAIRGKTKA